MKRLISTSALTLAVLALTALPALAQNWEHSGGGGGGVRPASARQGTAMWAHGQHSGRVSTTRVSAVGTLWAHGQHGAPAINAIEVPPLDAAPGTMIAQATSDEGTTRSFSFEPESDDAAPQPAQPAPCRCRGLFDFLLFR